MNDTIPVLKVGQCYIPSGYSYQETEDGGSVRVLYQGQDIACTRSVQAAKTAILRHVERLFRTRVDQAWGEQYYPQYWASGRWHPLRNADGSAVWRATAYEAKMKLLVFLASKKHRELVGCEGQLARASSTRRVLL